MSHYSYHTVVWKCDICDKETVILQGDVYNDKISLREKGWSIGRNLDFCPKCAIKYNRKYRWSRKDRIPTNKEKYPGCSPGTQAIRQPTNMDKEGKSI